jgi:CheY-like chemotaxis protein
VSQADDTALSANSAHRLAPITYAFTPDQTGVSRIEGITNQILVVVRLASATGSETFASHQQYLINGLVTAFRAGKAEGYTGMLCNGWPKGPQVPLSEEAIDRLHRQAAELRRMAASADERRLYVLANRYDGVVMRRAMYPSLSRADRQYLAASCREEIESRTAYSVPRGQSFLAPTQAAVAMAAHAVRRQFTVPDRSANPAIQSAIMNLAYLITAYGMVPNTSVTDLAATTDVVRTAPSNRHLLLVDDAADVLVSVGAFLVNAGFVVRKAASGDEALAIIASDPRIAALITDFAMPGLNGAELIEQAIQIHPGLRTLVITGYPNADGLDALHSKTTILAKPFRRTALIAVVRSLLETTEAESTTAPYPELINGT